MRDIDLCAIYKRIYRTSRALVPKGQHPTPLQRKLYWFSGVMALLGVLTALPPLWALVILAAGVLVTVVTLAITRTTKF